MIRIPSTEIKIKNDTRLLEYHYSEVGSISLTVQELIQTEDIWKFILSSLPNRMKTSFYSFSYQFVFHKLKFSFVRYDSGTTAEDRCSSLSVKYWAPIFISNLMISGNIQDKVKEIRLDI